MVLNEAELQGRPPMEVEQLIQMAQTAPEPGVGGRAEVNHGEFTQDSEAAFLAGQGWVYVYDTVTRVRSTTLRNLLPNLLRWKRPEDGSTIYTVYEPSEPPDMGKHLCMLHPTHANRALYNGMGLDTCKKATLRNEYQVMMHMRRKHGDIWDALERLKEEQKNDEDRRFQREMLTRLIGSNAVVTGSMVETFAPTDEVAEAAKPIAVPEAHVEERDGKKHYTVFCEAESCEQSFDSTAKVGVMNKYRAHVRREHTDA